MFDDKKLSALKLVIIPARLVKMRFDEDTIKMLLRIQWWNWPVEKIGHHMHFICRKKIDEFLKIADIL